MKVCNALLLSGLIATAPLPLFAEDFFSQPELLKPDTQSGTHKAYFASDILNRLSSYQNIMVDEPVIFIAKDSPYSGFKASDLAAISDLMRQSFTKGLQEEQMQSGNLKVVDEAGSNTLYMRIGIQNVYIRKNKRGLLAYTPVGAVVHGVVGAASEAVDKSTLVEMEVQIELLDSQSKEVLAAFSVNLGERAQKSAKTQEMAAGWEATGAVAELAGRRMACRFDNSRLPEGQRRDCVKELSLP